MIERIFFISDKAILSGDLPPEENIYFSILADPSVAGSLEDAYALIEQAFHAPLSLTLSIREELTAENIRFVASFLFIPSYLALEYRPVISLQSDSPELLSKAAASLSAYLPQQGFPDPFIYKIASGNNPLFRSVETLTLNYRRLLQNSPELHSGPESPPPVFFYTSSGEILQFAISSLQHVEMNFARETPQLYSLIHTNSTLKKELQALKRKQASTEAELNYQKQYVEVLRSDHATKELQDYYKNEYEILPMWYKRFGHILKVLTGKRTFQSLFSDNVKKYKD